MFGAGLLAEVVESADGEGRIERFELHFAGEREGMPHEVHARYRFTGQTAVVERTIEGVAHPTEALEMPANTVVLPLMRVFFGSVILKVAERGRGKPIPVLTPYLDDPSRRSRLLGPALDDRSASLLWDEIIVIDGQPSRAGCYTFLSRHHDETSKFWIDAGGKLLCYRYHPRDRSVWMIRSA